MGSSKTENTKKQDKREQLQQLLTKEKIKLQRLLEIMKLGSHSHHKNRLATLRIDTVDR